MELEEAKNRLEYINRWRDVGDEYKYTDLEAIETVLKALENSIDKEVIKSKIKELENEFAYYAGREHFDYQDGEFDGEVCDEIGNKITILKSLLEEK